MMKVVLIAALVVAVVGFPTLYQACGVLPDTGLGPHQDPMPFDGAYSFSFTDMDGNVVDSYTAGSEYMVTVTGAAPFRMTTIVDSGSFVTSDMTGEPVCDGLRVNNNDVVAAQTATWMADDAANATFAVNLAGGCPQNYAQGSLFVEAAM